MSVRPIVLLGDPRLRLKGETVDSFGKPLHELLDDLTDSMRHAPGVGLAAPQLGEPLRACVIEVENHLYELINPQIVRSTGDGTVAHLRNWIECMRSRARPNADIRIGHAAARTSHIANAALRAKRQVRWNAQAERVES